jgi:hypothetical protein
VSTLEPAGDDLWIADGPPVFFLSFRFPTRMVVARLPDKSLWLWSPIALDDRLRDDIAKLGEPRFVVEPNALHHLPLADWLKAFPKLRLWAPPGLAKKRTDLVFEGKLGDEPPDEWRDVIDQVRIRGSFALTEVVFFHRPSRTCIVGDLIQKFDPREISGWRGLMLRANSLVGPNGSTPREWRATFVKRDDARASVRRALAWTPEHLVIAHGLRVTERGEDALRRGLAWLSP